MKWALYGAAAVLLIGIGAALGGGGDTDDAANNDSPGLVNTSSPTVQPEESPDPEPPAEPEGKYGLASCDVNIDSSTAGGIDGELVGSTRVENTGEVELRAKVTFTWLYGNGTKEAARPKTVNVGRGGEKLVFFRHPATVDEISSFQDHPDYFDSGNCKTKATLS